MSACAGHAGACIAAGLCQCELVRCLHCSRTMSAWSAGQVSSRTMSAWAGQVPALQQDYVSVSWSVPALQQDYISVSWSGACIAAGLCQCELVSACIAAGLCQYGLLVRCLHCSRTMSAWAGQVPVLQQDYVSVGRSGACIAAGLCQFEKGHIRSCSMTMSV